VLLALAFPNVGARMYHVSLSRVALGAIGALLLFGSLLIANVVQTDSTLLTRLIAFVQFCAAATWAYASKLEIDEKLLIRALIVYAAFTVVYFATNGVVEDTLIRSRIDSSGDLLSAGRGARTLSPEPSFFALQVFNIFVLSRVLRLEETMDRRRSFLFFALLVFCLAASFSAYGALLILALLFSFYPKWFAVAALIVLSSFSVFYSYLPNWDSIRAIKVILALIESRGQIAQLMVLDQSFGVRIGSFLAYTDSFGRHPLTGDGFSVLQGGGFVSVIAAFGILALPFFALVLYRILGGKYRLSTKVVLLAWFVMNFVSGPVGIPILGVITGTLLAKHRRTAAPDDGTEASDHGVLLAT
jgi:hypothetical protein